MGPVDVYTHAQVTVRCMIHVNKMDVTRTDHVLLHGDGPVLRGGGEGEMEF